MPLSSTLSILWNEGSAVFTNSGYSLFNLEAHIVCIIVLVILFSRQQVYSDQTESQIIWNRMLFIQILYCLSGIFRVLVDVNVITRTNISQYIVTALNFGLFGCLCWLTFTYIEACQKSKLLDSLGRKILAASPFIFNVINLLTSPYTGSFIDISGESMRNGILFPLMVTINLAYPTVAVIIAMFRRSRMGKYERDTASIMAIYPAFFLICGPLQAFNWRIPFLCYAIMLSDLFVYINYADSLVSVDPLTKIPNRNGLIRYLTERMNRGDNETLYVFAVDIDDLGAINSSYGRGEGDHALVVTANALSKFRKEEHRCYISRYYSDEFVIAAEIESHDELELFTEHVRNYISNASINSRLPYHLRVSIGYAHYEQYSRTETISGMIEEADRLMNENKEQRKFQTLWRNKRVSPS